MNLDTEGSASNDNLGRSKLLFEAKKAHRLKKHCPNPVWKIEVGKIHAFSQPVLGSQTSPYLQEKLVLFGCQNVFNSISKVVESINGQYLKLAAS